MLITFVILYLAVTVLIGIAAARFIRGSGDFILAGRKLPLLVNAAALFALWFGSETVFGATSEFIQHGFMGIIEDPFGGALCLMLYAVFLARPLYRMNLLTLGDLYRNRYGKTVELTAALCMITTFFGYIAAQLVAMGILLNLIVEIPLYYGILLSAGVVTLYTVVGGMWAISVTDFFQSILIVTGLIAAAAAITAQAGGVMPVIRSAPEGFFNIIPEMTPAGLSEYLAAWVTLGLGSLASQDIFQRANAASSVTNAVRSAYLGALLYLGVSMIPLFIALAARKLYPEILTDDNQQILPLMVMKHTSLPVQILFFGALLSAILSTASGALLAPATILTENVIRPLARKRLDERHFLLFLRFSVVLIAAISAGMAVGRRNIYQLVGESYILGLVSLLVPLVAAVYWSKAKPAGAMLSMIMGLLSWVVFEFFINPGMPALIPAFLLSIAAMLAGSLVHIKTSK
ncbi:MAG: sodium:solute symporter [Chitinophagales bacterium]|nr:MAG: sodium:solute symporter [Chitinophagales bacterium]